MCERRVCCCGKVAVLQEGFMTISDTLGPVPAEPSRTFPGGQRIALRPPGPHATALQALHLTPSFSFASHTARNNYHPGESPTTDRA